jgi:hypothetical protein
LKVAIGNCIRDQNRLYASQIKPIEIGRGVGRLRRRSGDITAGLTIKRERFEGKIVVMTIKLTGAKVRAIEENL